MDQISYFLMTDLISLRNNNIELLRKLPRYLENYNLFNVSNVIGVRDYINTHPELTPEALLHHIKNYTHKDYIYGSYIRPISDAPTPDDKRRVN